MPSVRRFLAGTPFFGGLSDPALDLLKARLVVHELAAGSYAFRAGDTGASMYIIEHGEVVLCQQGDSGMQVRLRRLGPGDFFGETTLIEMQPRPYDAYVDSPARLLELDNRALYELYKTDILAYVMVLQNVNRELCRRLRRTDLRLTEFADEARDDATQVRMLVARPAGEPKR